MISQFFPIEDFVTLILECVQPVTQGGEEYFSSICSELYIKSLRNSLNDTYKAARLSINDSLEQISKPERITYLQNVKMYLLEPKEFDTFIREKSKLTNAVLALAQGRYSIQDTAYLRIQRLINQNLKSNDESAFNEEMKIEIASLLLVASGADQFWYLINEAVDKHIALITSNSSHTESGSKSKNQPPGLLFDSELSEEDEDNLIQVMDSVLEEMGAVTKDENGSFSTKASAQKGLKFVALFRLLVAFGKSRKPEHGENGQWIAFFFNRYGVTITEAYSRYQIGHTSRPFKRDLKKEYELITNKLPGLKRKYKLSF